MTAGGRNCCHIQLDLEISEDDHDQLVHLLAEIFHTERDAAPVLEQVGLGRRYWFFTQTSSLDAWRRMIETMLDGLLPTPYRRRVLSALRERPYNGDLLRLAARYGLSNSASFNDQEDAGGISAPAPPAGAGDRH